MSRDLIVVGSGIFGSVVGRYAQNLGLTVQWIDSSDPRAASPASAGLFKPEWLAALTGQAQREGMNVLESMFPVRSLQLKLLGLPRLLDFKQLSPEVILAQKSDIIKAKVTKVMSANAGGGHVVLGDPIDGRYLTAKRVIVAAGVGCNDIGFNLRAVERLQNVPPVISKVGVAFTWNYRSGGAEHFVLHPWAPYKQAMVFMRDPGVMWGGDGSALKPDSWTPERLKVSAKRVGELAHWMDGKVPNVTRLMGHRPIVDGHKGGYLNQVMPGVWVMTGGGKIGTVAAGSLAAEWARQAGVA